jgi:hypothetical protein
MTSSIFLFTRTVEQSGSPMRQAVTIFAEDLPSANVLLAEHLRLVEENAKHRHAAYQPSPAFNVDTVPLDEPKLITSLITR